MCKFEEKVIHRFKNHLPEVVTQGKTPQKNLSSHDPQIFYSFVKKNFFD